MKTTATSPLALATDPSGPSLVEEAFGALAESFAQFCPMAGMKSLTQMMGCDVTRLAAVRRALKQAWERNDAEKAERLILNLARRFAQGPPDVSRSILEGLDGILTVIRLGLPPELRRSLASRNIIEAMSSVIRLVCRNVQRWRHAKMALRRTAAGMFEAKKGFRRIKAYKQRPIRKKALTDHRQKREPDQIKDAA